MLTNAFKVASYRIYWKQDVLRLSALDILVWIELIVGTYHSPPSVPCGGTFYATDDPQTIMTPGYPNNYPVNQRCSWIIDANATTQVRLEVTDMDLEAENDCSNDYVELRDYPEVRSIRNYNRWNCKF